MDKSEIMLLELMIAHPNHSHHLNSLWFEMKEIEKEEFFMLDWRDRELVLAQSNFIFTHGDYKA